MLDLSRSFEVAPNVYIGIGLSKAFNSNSGGRMTDKKDTIALIGQMAGRVLLNGLINIP